MKTFALVALTVGILNQANAVEPVQTSAASLVLSKIEIAAILDIKTKQHIEISPIVLQPLMAPTDIVLLAREDRATRTKSITSKNVGDE